MFEMRPYRRNDNNIYDPFDDFDRFERNFWSSPFDMLDHSLVTMSADIKDEGDKYSLAVDMPGFDKKDIKIDIKNDVMTISAERHSDKEKKDEKGKFIRSERSYGSYSRQFDVSEVDTDKISAKYENGVLTLDMPKKDTGIDSAKHLEIE